MFPINAKQICVVDITPWKRVYCLKKSGKCICALLLDCKTHIAISDILDPKEKNLLLLYMLINIYNNLLNH